MQRKRNKTLEPKGVFCARVKKIVGHGPNRKESNTLDFGFNELAIK